MSILNGQQVPYILSDILRLRNMYRIICMRVSFFSWIPAANIMVITFMINCRVTCLLIISWSTEKGGWLSTIKVLRPSNKCWNLGFTRLDGDLFVKLMISLLDHCFISAREIFRYFSPFVRIGLIKTQQLFVFNSAEFFQLRELWL